MKPQLGTEETPIEGEDIYAFFGFQLCNSVAGEINLWPKQLNSN
jgi:hypothetical protein